MVSENIKSLIGLKVYPDTFTKYLNWDVDYFEVYIRPTDRFNKPIDLKSQLEIHKPIRERVLGIHGGILHHGVNLMDGDLYDYNMYSIKLTLDAADYFPNCKYIVFHAGNIIFNRNCSFKNLIDIVSSIKDPRFLVENEPIFGYAPRYCFPLHLIEDWCELKRLMNKEMLIDSGHALITAYAMSYSPGEYLNSFINALNPPVIHMAMKGYENDGYDDAHCHLYEGEFDLFEIRNVLAGKMLTIEVNDPDLVDLRFVQAMLSGKFSSRQEFLNAL